MQRSFIGLSLILILVFGISETHAVQFQWHSSAAAEQDFSSEERDEQVYRTAAANPHEDEWAKTCRPFTSNCRFFPRVSIWRFSPIRTAHF